MPGLGFLVLPGFRDAPVAPILARRPAPGSADTASAGPGQEPRVQCSFCGKRRDQVAGLAVSSAQTGRKLPAAICTECLDLCTEIITEELGEPPAT